MEVLSHRDPDSLDRLVEAVGRGRVICLIADRDLGQAGVPVRWRGVPITMPAGPGPGGAPERSGPDPRRVSLRWSRDAHHAWDP